MSKNPFVADPQVAARIARLAAEVGAAVAAAAREALRASGTSAAANDGGVLPKAQVEALMARFGLESPRDLMLLLLDLARDIASPPISDFHVGAVGLEAQTGNLVLGGNVEFPGTHLATTLHGEGFVFTRAMSRGTDIAVIAIGEAHPCAHCRQCLAEYAASDRLELIDPLGHTLTLAELYPWPFDPDYLGESGAVPGRELWPDLAATGPSEAPSPALLAAGRRSHSPYSKCPGAIVLRLRNGEDISGFAIESVAFNPTIHPLQGAMVNLIAHGHGAADIAAAELGTVRGGAVDYTRSTEELLDAIAPGVPLTVTGWAPSPGGAHDADAQ